MARHHLVRVGALGSVGRFTAVDAVVYPRHTSVVVRTGRGLELGEVLSPPGGQFDETPGDGSILRGVTEADRLLKLRLEKNRQAAFEACAKRLAEMGSPSVLVDVEHLFDGRTLLFYFLGEIPPEVEALTGELAELYEAQAQFRAFAQAVTEGCGPGCGTDAATGHGCTSCASGCSVAGLCATKHR
jgi:cell fate regulator YaaT (PSP1 superfamily)